MRIGIDVRVLTTSRALSRYTANIVDGLLRLGSDRHFFYLFTSDMASLSKVGAVNLGLPGLQYEAVSAPPKWVLRDHFFFYDSIGRLNLDVFFHPDNTEFLRCHHASVVTLHDTMPWKIPAFIRSYRPFSRLRQDLYFRLQEKALQEHATKIIAVSESTKEDIVKVLGIAPEKVTVIYEGVERSFHRELDKELIEKVKAKYDIFGPYLLYLGGFERHKNLTNLLRAFGQTYTHNLKLVLAGGAAGHEEELRRFVRDLGMEETVVFTGFIEERDLPEIYSGAVLFLYPSLYEGFGFPPLEAMACGTPTVMSRSSSLTEVGGEAAIYFDPENVGSIAGALQQALQLYVNHRTEYEEWSQRCQRQASFFSWEKAARETLMVLETTGK